MFYLFLFTAGTSVGFLSGLLGIGGGILMFPVLVYGPHFLGLGSIDVRYITGLTMIQGFFASLSAMIFYRRTGFVNIPLVLTLGVTLFISSLIGALMTDQVSERIILLLFGILAILAAVLMVLPRSYKRDEVSAQEVSFNRPFTILIGLALGAVLGLVGQGGAFIIIPVLLYILKVPLRVAIGSMLAIGIFSSTAGLAGKITTGNVPYLMALTMVSGAIPAAWMGGVVGKKTNTKILRWLLAVVITLAAIRLSMDIF